MSRSRLEIKRSWWSLKIHDYPKYQPNDADLQHIAKKITEGYDSGELIQEIEEDEPVCPNIDENLSS